MNEFWVTDITVPEGVGFSLWGRGHLLWLTVTAVLCAMMVIVYRKQSGPDRAIFRRVTAALLILDELFKYGIVACSGVFWMGFLPLHLCSINIFLILADAIKPNERLRELLCAVCLPGAFFALLFPGWAYLPMNCAMNYHRFTAHILLLLYPALLLADDFHPRFSRLLSTLPWCLPVLAGIYVFNKIFDTNFFFFNWAGEGNPLSLLEIWLGRPGYLVGIPILAGLCWILLYGVAGALDRRRRP